MLKIYTLTQKQGKIELNDGIQFEKPDYMNYRGYNAEYGIVIDYDLAEANYIFSGLKEFMANIRYRTGHIIRDETEKMYLKDLFIQCATDYENMKKIRERFSQDEETFKKYDLNIEAIFLLTKYINLKSHTNDLVENIFDRLIPKTGKTGLYILKPHATITAYTEDYHRYEEVTYEALQSQNLGHELILTKVKR